MKNGFTLIELLVSITIIAIISAVGLITYKQTFSASRDFIRKNDLKELATALELYYQKNNHYILPASGNESCTRDTPRFYESITPFISGNTVPLDPKDKNQYCYISINNGDSYRLFAKLENCSNSTLCSNANYNYSLVSENLNLTSAPGDTTAKQPPCGIVGDANNDGQISKADSDLVLEWDGQPSLLDDQLTRGDVNKRNGVNSMDALCIQRYIAGNDSTFGACPDANSTTIPGAGCRPPLQLP